MEDEDEVFGEMDWSNKRRAREHRQLAAEEPVMTSSIYSLPLSSAVRYQLNNLDQRTNQFSPDLYHTLLQRLHFSSILSNNSLATKAFNLTARIRAYEAGFSY